MSEQTTQEPTIKKVGKKVYFWVAILYLLFMSDFLCRVGINAIFPIIQADLKLTDQQVGYMGSVVLLAMGIGALPIAFIADKWSKKKMVTIMSGLWAASTGLFAVASAFPLMLLGRLGVGVGNAAYAPTATSMITSWFPKEQWGRLLGIFNTAMPLGSAIGAFICGALATQIGWRSTVGVCAIFSFIICILSLFIPETNGKKMKKVAAKAAETAKAASNITVKDAAKVLLKNRSLVLVCLAAAFFNFATGLHQTWTVMFYVRDVGISTAMAASIVGLTSLIGTTAYPVGGLIMDKWYPKDIRSRAWFPAIIYSVKGLICIFAFATKNIPLIIFASWLLQLAVSCGHAANQELVPDRYKAMSYGFYVVFIQLAGAIGPTVGGYFSSIFGLHHMMIGAQGIYFISTFFWILAGIFYVQDFKKARQEEAEGSIA